MVVIGLKHVLLFIFVFISLWLIVIVRMLATISPDTSERFEKMKDSLYMFRDKDKEITRPCSKCHGEYEVVPGVEKNDNDGLIYLAKDLQEFRHVAQHFNESLSSVLALDKDRGDVRNGACKNAVYPEKLPTTSIVFVFWNEPLHSLWRSVYSILDKTPPELLNEIILVDDFSDSPHCGKPLEDFVNAHPKVVLVRLKERMGLIRGRIAGAEAATGDTVTFLDSHVEATVGWAEPLLARIAEDRTNVVYPVVDVIDFTTFDYNSGTTHHIVTFRWDMIMEWALPAKISPPRAKHEPIPSVAMPGGLFTMDRGYFFEVGSYDSGMNTWGGENVEISFRVWQCGGRVELIPCSHFGHIFRNKFPYTIIEKEIAVNKLRVAAVWLDDYTDLTYAAVGKNKDWPIGDIDGRVELRNRLECKDFEWLMDNIFEYADGYDKKHWRLTASGTLKPKNKETMCMEVTHFKEDLSSNKVGMYGCHGTGIQFLMMNEYNQLFYANALSKTKNKSWCLTAADKNGGALSFKNCEANNNLQQFPWVESDGRIKFKLSGECLTYDDGDNQNPVTLKPCGDLTDLRQYWTWSKVWHLRLEAGFNTTTSKSNLRQEE